MQFDIPATFYLDGTTYNHTRLRKSKNSGAVTLTNDVKFKNYILLEGFIPCQSFNSILDPSFIPDSVREDIKFVDYFFVKIRFPVAHDALTYKQAFSVIRSR